jgi:rhamnosyltransferase
MHDDRVVVLMAVYNGEKYLGTQLDSILGQTYRNWELFIRDDYSSDNTVNIVKKYVLRDPRIKLLDDGKGRLGACFNFSELVATTLSLECKYYMFSDQDDVWKNQKIEKSISFIKYMEKKIENDMPVLVHSDFQYVDEYLSYIPTKVNVAQKLSRSKNLLKLVANDNYIFGCTIIVNKALLKLSNIAPPEAINYDNWLVLHAAAFGHIYYMNEKTMLYRQHDNNVSGGLQYSYLQNRIHRLLNLRAYINTREKYLLQFCSFVASRQNLFMNDQLELLNKFILYSRTGGVSSVLFMIKNKFVMRGFMQTILYYLSIFLGK